GDRGGYHIVMVEGRRAIAAKPLSEVQEELRNRLSNESVMKEREHYLAQLRKTAQIGEKLIPAVAISMGDPLGIGPEVVALALADLRVRSAMDAVVFGDRGTME